MTSLLMSSPPISISHRLLDADIQIPETYSRLPVTRTLHNSNLPLTRSNFHFPSDHFPYILPSTTRTPDNSNFFPFPLKVRIIGSRLYIFFVYVHSFDITCSCFCIELFLQQSSWSLKNVASFICNVFRSVKEDRVVSFLFFFFFFSSWPE